jgi:hypothetical protein
MGAAGRRGTSQDVSRGKHPYMVHLRRMAPKKGGGASQGRPAHASESAAPGCPTKSAAHIVRGAEYTGAGATRLATGGLRGSTPGSCAFLAAAVPAACGFGLDSPFCRGPAAAACCARSTCGGTACEMVAAPA